MGGQRAEASRDGSKGDSGKSDRREAGVGRGKIWVLDAAGQPKAIRVRTGISDGSVTEVQGEEITEGLSVLIGQVSTQSRGSATGATNPFAPPTFRR